MNVCFITELTGTPCAGKSFLHKRGFFPDFALRRGLRCAFNFTDLCVILKLFLLALREEVSLAYRLRIIFGITKKFLIFRSACRAKNKVCIDEGVSHIPFNLLNTDPSVVVGLLKPYLNSISVVVVTISDEVLRDRLLTRGHPRLKFCGVPKFIDDNRKVLNCLLSEYPVLCYEFSEVGNDTNL